MTDQHTPAPPATPPAPPAASPPAEAAAGDAPAWRSRTAWTRLALVTLFGLVTDLGSKWLAFRFIAPQPVVIDRAQVLRAGPNLGTIIGHAEPLTVIPHVLDFTLVLNRGAVFGIGAGRRWFFILFTMGALVLALWMFGTWTRVRDRWAHIALGLLISGGVGNLYDRVIYACVRDFIHPLPGVLLPFGWRWPNGEREVWPYVSNIADLWLLIGIGILMIYLWRQGKTPAPKAAA